MEKKRNTNLESKRNGFFFTGIVIALGFSLVAFEWRQGNFMSEEMALYSEAENGLTDDDQPVEIRKRNVPVAKVVEKKADIKEVKKLKQLVVDVIDTNQIVIDDFDIRFPIDTTDQDPPIIPDIPEGPERFVDRAPVYPGGQTALYKLLKTNIKYPELAYENRYQGVVYVEFVVEK
ncbi:MAG: hypothetical protein JKY54_10155, partial [Flavobacteriales bacterium]|nr:hypothetical protein [Flavobacteriales bacterium]